MNQDAYRCQDCEWSRPVGIGSTRREITKGAISHHVETGHEIVFEDRSRDVSPTRWRTTSGRMATGSDD